MAADPGHSGRDMFEVSAQAARQLVCLMLGLVNLLAFNKLAQVTLGSDLFTTGFSDMKPGHILLIVLYLASMRLLFVGERRGHKGY